MAVLRRIWPALALLAACGPGDDASGGEASEAATAAATGGSTDASGSTGGATTGGGTTGDASASGSGEESEGASAPVIPDLGVPECGELTRCGLLCADLGSDPSNCGACGISCVVPRAEGLCQDGLCVMGACDAGWGDCDGEIGNGCEEPLDEGMSCAQVCKPDFAESCNLFDDNCDGACDEGALPGCRQAVHRANSGSLGHFYTNDLNEAMSGGYSLENADYFHLYTAALPGVVPFYRCLKGNGKRFYTRSANCEGAGPVEGVLGHIATEGLCGATELYRLYSGGSGDHFYTVSAAERDNAVSMYGYKYESVAGFVWLAP